MFSSKMPILLLLSIVFLFNSNIDAQEEKLIPPKKLMKDMENFEQFLRTHPDPYAHISEAEFSRKFTTMKSSLNVPHTQLEFYKKLASTVALIKDGHSSVSFSQFWREKKRKEFGCFPYEMYLTTDNQLFVLQNYNSGEMKPGAKVLSIEGIKVDSFLSIIDPFISYERLAFRNTIIDNDFEKYLYLVFNKSHDLTFKYLDFGEKETVVESMPFREWKSFQKNDREERELLMSQGKPFAYEKVNDGVGMISIYGFFAADLNVYNSFLQKTFKSIQKDSIHSLIIDIRGNYGGWPKIASNLFHYISDRYFKTMAQSSMKVSYPYRNYFKDKYPILRTQGFAIPKRSHMVDLDAILNNKIGDFIDEAAFYNEPPYTASSEFRGDVYLLTNRDSYSAASSFASTFQCYSMGMIIGEETGGTKIFRANAIKEKLSNSGINIRLSTTKFYSACYSDEMKGVTPNVRYSPSIYELLSDMDTHLLFAERVIQEVRQKKVGAGVPVN